MPKSKKAQKATRIQPRMPPPARARPKRREHGPNRNQLGTSKQIMAPRAVTSIVTGQSFGRSLNCPSIGNTPGQAFAAKGVSGVFALAVTSGAQTADQFAYCPITPQGAFTATTTHGITTVPTTTHLTGEVAQAVTADFDTFWTQEIEVSYTPLVPTSFSGEVAIAIIPEISSIPDPSIITALLDVPLSTMGPAWAPLTIRYRPGATPVRFSDTKRMATGSSTSLADTCNGLLVIGVSGLNNNTTLGSSISVGRIEAKAHWCLWTPSSPGLQ